MDKLCHFLAFRHKLAMASRISALMPGHQQFSYAAFIPTLSEKHLAALHIGLCNDWHKQKRQSIKPNSCSLRCLVCNSCQKSWSDESIGTLSSFQYGEGTSLGQKNLLSPFKTSLTTVTAFPSGMVSLFLLKFLFLDLWYPQLQPLSQIRLHQNPVQCFNTSFALQPNWDVNIVF